MTSRPITIIVGVALVASAVWHLGPWGREFRLPARIALEDVVADPFQTIDSAAVVDQPPGDPVRLGGIAPGHDLELNGGWRQAVVAPPRSRIRARTEFPDGSRLSFSIAVGGGEDAAEDPNAAAVRFVVEADGHELFARTLDPARDKQARRWVTADVELPHGGEHELVLRTERLGPGTRVPGPAGWSHVRVVHATARDRQPATPAAPSVLVLLVDTLRADRLGCYGAVPSMTPTLDRLAATGLVVDEMVSASSWTMPAVATLFTGLYPQSHGVLGRPPDDWEGRDEVDPEFLSDGLPTLSTLAQDRGITTVAVSANPIISRATNFARGFETFVETGWDPKEHDWTPAREVNATFLRWLRVNRGRRFLGYLHYMEPHDPYTPTASRRPSPPPGVRPAIAAGDVEGVSRRLRHGAGTPLPAEELDYVRTLYGLEVRDWDRALGPLLDGVRALGVADSTVIVVLGDHGEEFQEHGLLKHGVHLYDELLHVPVVVAGPAIAPGRLAGQVQGVDLFPTIAALLGVTPPAGVPGQNFLAAHEPRPAFSSTRYGIPVRGQVTELVAVRAGGWKLIEAPRLGTAELYDLAQDPGEQRNLAGAPEQARLASFLAVWRGTLPAPPAVTGHDPQLHEKLRALGYVD